MLPRQVIQNHALDVMECILLRNPGEDIIHALNTIRVVGPECDALLKTIEAQRAERNTLSAKFKSATPTERADLQARVKELKVELATNEARQVALDAHLKDLESLVPNIPSPDVPLSKDLSQEDAEWKKLLLRRVNRLVAEYNQPAPDWE